MPTIDSGSRQLWKKRRRRSSQPCRSSCPFLWIASSTVVFLLLRQRITTPSPIAVAPFQLNHRTMEDRHRPRLIPPYSKGTNSSANTTSRLAAFDDLDLFGDDSRLSKRWDLWPTDQDVSMEAVDANSCFGSKGWSNSIKCLPSFIIAGFEKSGTSVLDIWLSRHPNLLTPYGETRFFHSSLQHGDRLERGWHRYLDSMPVVPNVGSYFVYEKTPGYANNPDDARMMAKVVPSAKLLFVTRNPADRAYSHFNMYMHIYGFYSGLTTPIKNHLQPVSYFVKHTKTGDVACVRDFDPVEEPGLGGTLLNGEWVYLSYPVDPVDFDVFVRKAAQKPVDLMDHSRSNHILAPGLYSLYLKEYLEYFPPEQIVIIPSELFFPADKALQSLENLQQMLGLPSYDYGPLMRREDGRLESDSFHTVLLQHFVDHRHQQPMLNSTRELLNDYYCETNRELSRMLGNRKLPGYSCT